MSATTIVRLNNRGIELLGQRDADGAASCFLAAMSTARRLTSEETRDQTLSEPFVPEENVSTKYAAANVAAVRYFCTQEVSVQSSKQFTFYERVFILDRNFDARSDCILATAILLYNLAFAYHCEGTSLGNEKALRSYKLGLKLIKESLPSRANVDLLLVALALLNNMGHTLALSSKLQDAEACNERIHFLLESSLPIFLAQEDDEFHNFMEFFLQQEETFAIAPAA